MENILTVVLIREVDIIEEEREVFEEPLSKVEVDCGSLQEADVKHCLPHTASVLNLRKYFAMLQRNEEG